MTFRVTHPCILSLCSLLACAGSSKDAASDEQPASEAGYAFTKLFLHPGGMKVGVISDLLVAREDREGMAALLGTATHDLERAGGDVLKCTFTPLWARRVAERFGSLDPKRFLPPTRWPGRRVFSAPGPVPLPTSLEDGWLTRGDSEMDFNDAVRGSTMLDPAPF